MKMPIDCIKNFIGKKVLIKGEVKSGKTKLCEEILNEMIKYFPPSKITVIDLAPSKKYFKDIILGGTMSVPNGVIYLRPSIIYAPRLEGKNKEEVLELARRNAMNIENIFKIYENNHSEILFINDITLYFHAGSFERIIELIKYPKTLICNAYEGEKLHDDKESGITIREREMLKKFEEYMDIIIKL
jgi:hypothetical protein